LIVHAYDTAPVVAILMDEIHKLCGLGLDGLSLSPGSFSGCKVIQLPLDNGDHLRGHVVAIEESLNDPPNFVHHSLCK